MPHPERLAPSHPITRLYRGRRVTCLRACNQIDATRESTNVGSTLFPVCRISCDIDADKLLCPEPVVVCEAKIPMVRVTSRIERVLPLHTRRSSYVLGFSSPAARRRPRDLFVLQMPRAVPIGRRRLLLQAADTLCESDGRLIPRNSCERSSECL